MGVGAPSPPRAILPRMPRPVRVAHRRLLGRYIVGKKLGAGGMARVYLARDPVLQRELAIKVISPRERNDAAKDRLFREAQAMACLEHPNVVPVFDVGTTGDKVYLVMPHLAGGTLAQWLDAESRPWRAVLARFIAAGRGLCAAHAKGLVHRDFKPDNVLLGQDNEVRVADFGLAQVAREPTPDPTVSPAEVALERLTRTGTIVGTPIYMAPEQLAGEPADARSDQFSFCVALWEGLYGERPFRPDPIARSSDVDLLIDAIRRGPATPPANGHRVPHWLRALVARGLRPDPAARWPSLDELLDRADARSRLRRRVATALAGGGIVAACIVIAVAVTSASGESPQRREGVSAVTIASPAHGFRTSRVTARGRISEGALSPDGASVAWVVNNDIVIQSTAGAASSRVVLRDAPDATLAFAPGGDRLAVTNPPGRTRIVDVKSGAVLLDAAVGSPHLAFAGPDALVYSDHGATLELRPLASLIESRTCALPAFVQSVAEIAASETGEVLLVVDRHDGQRALMRVGADCKDAVLLRTDRWLNSIAAGRDRFYGLRRNAGEVSLVSLARDGRVLEVRAIDGDVTDLAGVAPDGRAYFTRTEYEWRLVELGGKHGPAELSAGAQRTELSGSPDGSSVAWIEDGDDRRALRIAPADRMADRPPPIATAVMTVAWAPDGRQLAAIVDAGGRYEVVVMDLAGAVLRRLPIAGVDAEDWMSWLGTDALVATTFDNRNLVRIDLASGAVEPMLEERGEIADPQTRPDGTILFEWDRDDRGASGIWLRAPDGELTHLREDADSSVHAAWTPAGDAIVFYDRKSGQVWRMARSGGDPVRVVTVPLTGNEWMPALWLRGPDRMVAHVVRRTSDLHVSRPE